MRPNASAMVGPFEHPRRGGFPFFALLAAMAVPACGSEVVVHGVGEKEANLILEVLATNDVHAGKVMNSAGREVVYNISVSGGRAIEAIKILNQYDLPRRRDRGYHDVFAGSGLIPTSSEEKAKRLAALEGEIERQLKLVEGVLDVQVQIVVPEGSALRTTKEQTPLTTASVTVKYLPDARGGRPLSEPEIQALVAAGVEDLRPENVVVLMRATAPALSRAEREAAARPTGILRLGPQALDAVFVGLVGLVGVLALLLLVSEWRVRTVRGRLIRLQNEIARARKKTPEALQPPASQAAS